MPSWLGLPGRDVSAPRPAAAGSQGFILGPDEGDQVLSHLIKVDPALGSQRLGIGMQQMEAGRGIALHIHDGEDEVLFVGLQGSVEIRDERAEDLGFIGVWQAGNRQTGEFILTYDFASGSAIHLKWGDNFGQHATLRRIR